MRKILCFLGFHKWWYSHTLDGVLVYPLDGQRRICRYCEKEQVFICDEPFGAGRWV